MRAPGKFFAIGLVIFGLLCLSLPLINAGPNDATLTPAPSSLFPVQNQTTYVYYQYATGNPDYYPGYNYPLRIYIKYTYIPTGITVAYNANGVGNWNTIADLDNGNTLVSYQAWVQVASNAIFNVAQKIEFDVYFKSTDIPSMPSGTAIFWGYHSYFTVTPLLAQEYKIGVSQSYASLLKNENFPYTITITNYLPQAVAWDISTSHILTGFSVSPTVGSLDVPSNGSLSWTTYITATGQGLVQGTTYNGAAVFMCHNRYRDIDVGGGYVNITYLSPPEDIEDFQIWLDPAEGHIPIGSYENILLYIQNLGGHDITIENIILTTVDFNASIYPNQKLSIGVGENIYYTISVYFAPGGQSPGIMIIKVFDNYGTSRTVSAKLYTAPGPFVVSIVPDEVEIAPLQSKDINMTIKNNENENRTYYVAWSNMSSIGFNAVPPIMDIAIPAYNYTTVRFSIYLGSAASSSIGSKIPFDVIITSNAGGYIDTFVNVSIVSAEGGQYTPTGGFSAMIFLLLPLTNGDATMAGYMVGAFFFIVPLTVVGLAVVAAASRRGKTGYGGLVILSFYLLGLFITTVGGLFPVWFLVSHIAIIALIFARGWFTGRGGGED